MSVNKVILVGRLGKDPEVRAFENGSKKANFTLATSEYYRDKEGKKIEQTEWHNIYCWRKLAEFAEQWLTKGKQVYIEGRLRTRSWEDNGAKRYTTEIEATNITLLGSKSDGGNDLVTKVNNNNNETPPSEPTPDIPSANVNDDWPF